MGAGPLDAARAALTGGAPADLTVLVRGDGAPAVAFLVTLAREDGDLVVPLAAGPNLVGRGTSGARPFGSWPEPRAVEQSQWVIECRGTAASVRDASSTSGSMLLHADLVAALPAAIPAGPFDALHTLPGAVELAHPERAAPRHTHALHEGDCLRGCYAAFLFGWLRASTGSC